MLVLGRTFPIFRQTRFPQRRLLCKSLPHNLSHLVTIRSWPELEERTLSGRFHGIRSIAAGMNINQKTNYAISPVLS